MRNADAARHTRTKPVAETFETALREATLSLVLRRVHNLRYIFLWHFIHRCQPAANAARQSTRCRAAPEALKFVTSLSINLDRSFAILL